MTNIARVNVRSGKVRVNTTAIDSMFLETGQVGRQAKRVGREIKRQAIAEAPKRSGELSGSHDGPWYSKTRLGGHITVGNHAPHALYVHEGTVGPIFPTRGEFLWIRPTPHSWFAYDPQWVEYGGRTPQPRVRGQSANPWLADAMRLIVRLEFI